MENSLMLEDVGYLSYAKERFKQILRYFVCNSDSSYLYPKLIKNGIMKGLYSLIEKINKCDGDITIHEYNIHELKTKFGFIVDVYGKDIVDIHKNGILDTAQNLIHTTEQFDKKLRTPEESIQNNICKVTNSVLARSLEKYDNDRYYLLNCRISAHCGMGVYVDFTNYNFIRDKVIIVGRNIPIRAGDVIRRDEMLQNVRHLEYYMDNLGSIINTSKSLGRSLNRSITYYNAVMRDTISNSKLSSRKEDYNVALLKASLLQQYRDEYLLEYTNLSAFKALIALDYYKILCADLY